ncbi:MAG TPA: ABC transporter transmembrane domain-containing protein [Usitatibacter sp.]|jgi:hypothetical protein|nr:ABC transporter transmembrane domain-containing protein [Usitatibacter sp.]
MRADPGISFRSMTLEAAWSLLAQPLGVPAREPGAIAVQEDDAAEVIEGIAEAVGLRARRVILDTRWWRHAGAPMLARLSERRRKPREDDSEDAMRGWVALVPHPHDGYRMRALDPSAGAVIEWRVDAALAARLAPHAFTFHRRFPDRPLAPRDLLAFATAHGRRDLALLLGAGLMAALLGLLAPAATGWLIDRAIPAGNSGRVLALIAGLAVAGVALIALDVLRTLAVMRFAARVGVSLQAALVDRVLAAPARFLRGYASGDLALRIGAVNTLQRTLLDATLAALVTTLFVLANAALMLHYSAQLSAAAFAIALLVVAVSALAGALRLRIGPRIEALDGSVGAITYELFAGIAKLRRPAPRSGLSRAGTAATMRFATRRARAHASPTGKPSRSACCNPPRPPWCSISRGASPAAPCCPPGTSSHSMPRCSRCWAACMRWRRRSSTW